jgi:hypothetical protein
MSFITNPQEAVMGQAIPAKPPTVVRKNPMRALLAFVALAVVGIAVTAVILTNNNDNGTTDANVASRGPAPAQTTQGLRYDGGPEEGTRGITQSPQPGTRYDGGPEEGTAAIAASTPAPSTAGQRYDGGPEEGSASIARSSTPVAPVGIPSPAAARNLEQSGQIELRRDPHSAAAQLHQLQGR